MAREFHNPIETLFKDAKSIPFTFIYMTAHFPTLVWAFYEKVAGINTVLWVTISPFGELMLSNDVCILQTLL
jgi:hypothetical protein